MDGSTSLAWMNGTPLNAPRITDETWDRFKEVILQQYLDHNLEAAMKHMKDHHGFVATKRQFIHRIGTKWGTKKYKYSRGSEEPLSRNTAPRSKRVRPSSPSRDQSHPSDIQSPSFPQSTVPLLVSDDEMSDIATAHLPRRPAKKHSIDGEDSSHGWGAPDQPRVVILGSEEKLSCPYRKRNPFRFNVRDYQSCAVASFPEISQLKRHIKNFHKRRHQERCPRCKRGFDTKDAVEVHLQVPTREICDLQPPAEDDPEDGITEATEDWLLDRKANTKVDNWDSLWHLLFPLDKTVLPSDFHPVVEAVELERYLKLHLTSLAAMLNIQLPDVPLEKLRSGLDQSMNTLLKSFHIVAKRGTHLVDDESMAPGRKKMDSAGRSFKPAQRENTIRALQLQLSNHLESNDILALPTVLANLWQQSPKPGTDQCDSQAIPSDPEYISTEFPEGFPVDTGLWNKEASPPVVVEEGEKTI